MQKVIECLNTSTVFDSVEKAAKWVRDHTKYTNASFDHIHFVSTEKLVEAYGLIWQLKEVKMNTINPMAKKTVPKNISSKEVYCISLKANEPTIRFFSIADATRFLMNTLHLPNAAASAITVCCQGKTKTAYGYVWRYVDT